MGAQAGSTRAGVTAMESALRELKHAESGFLWSSRSANFIFCLQRFGLACSTSFIWIGVGGHTGTALEMQIKQVETLA